jgi:hypothetical protein
MGGLRYGSRKNSTGPSLEEWLRSMYDCHEFVLDNFFALINTQPGVCKVGKMVIEKGTHSPVATRFGPKNRLRK